MSQNTPRRVRKYALSALGAILILYSTSCSDEEKRSDSSTRPEQLCSHVLDHPAVASLTKLAGTRKFGELSDPERAGHRSDFSVTKLVKKLHTTGHMYDVECLIYISSDKSGTPYVDISFTAYSWDLGIDKAKKRARSKASQPNNPHGRVIYDVGAYASTSKDDAQLAFKCSVQAPGKKVKLIVSDMYRNADRDIPFTSTPRDPLTILNSVDQKVAQKLGCLSESHLPRRITHLVKIGYTD